MTRRAIGTLICIVVIIAATILVAYCRPKPTPVPPKEQKSLDSLAITKPAFDSTVQAKAKAETVYIARARENAAIAASVRHVADSLRQVAIVAQRAAEDARDTSSRWFRVAQLNRQEADTLRVALDRQTARADNLFEAMTTAEARAQLLTARLVSVEDLNHRLTADLQRSDPPCRVAFIAKCPSRRVSAVLGAGAALGVALYGRQLVALVRP